MLPEIPHATLSLMKLNMYLHLACGLFLLIHLTSISLARAEIFTDQSLGDKWHSESIYFVPDDPNSVTSWQGIIYEYKRSKCFTIEHQPPQKPKGKIISCPENVKKRAKLIRQGTIDLGETREFPSKLFHGGLGQRGIFKLIDGGWRLISYVAGD